MERRKANRCSYNKLASKDPRTVSVTSLRRSRSMRASFRLLKVKLNQANLSTTPFKFNTPLHKHFQNYKKFSKGEDEQQQSATKSPINVNENEKGTRKSSKQLFKDTDSSPISSNESGINNMNEFIACSTSHHYIEDIMSSMPIGDVPRKACKLLQIPESYCRKYLSELHEEQQKREKHSNALNGAIDPIYIALSNNRKKQICEDLSKSVGQGIYGTTRLRTATIRKPMPYLNSSMCLFCFCFDFPNNFSIVTLSVCMCVCACMGVFTRK